MKISLLFMAFLGLLSPLGLDSTSHITHKIEPKMALNENDGNIFNVILDGNYITEDYFEFPKNYDTIKSAKLTLSNNTNDNVIFQTHYKNELISSSTLSYGTLTENLFDLTDNFKNITPGGIFYIKLFTPLGITNFNAKANLTITFSNTNQTIENEVEKDLYNLGFSLLDYTEETPPTLLLFTEINEDLYLYCFNYATGKDFVNFTFSTRASNYEETLDTATYEYKSCSLNFIACSDNKQFTKYKVLDFDVKKEYKYRQYDLHKLNYVVSGEEYITLEDSYIFYNNNDGSLSYSKKGYEYITLSNVNVYNRLLVQNTALENWFGYNLYGRYTSWYGFNCDNYKIEDLLEIQITALEYDLEFKMSEDYKYAFAFDEDEEKIEKLYIITPQIKEYEKRYIFKKEICSWNQILKLADVDNLYSNGKLGEDIYSFAKEYFSNNEFMVNFADFAYKADSKYAVSLFSWDPNSGFYDAENPILDFSSMSNDDIICYHLWKNYYNQALPSGFPTISQGYRYNIINTKGNSDAQAVRMKFIDINENYYDLAVITTPKDSQGTTSDGQHGTIQEQIDNLTKSWNDFISFFTKGFLHIKNFFNSISDFFVKFPWVGWPILAFFVLLILWKFIRWIKK